MRIIYQAFLSLSLLLFFIAPTDLSATHVTGASISYACTGPCTYRIYHTTYYDCAGAATPLPPATPPLPVLSFLASPGCGQPTGIGNWVLSSYTEVTPVCPGTPTRCTNQNAAIYGVMEAIYYRDYNFCNVNCTTGVYEVTWSTCCRNGAITSGAANTGIYIKGTKIDLGASPCNSSPTFLNPGRASICAGRSTTVNIGATDPDGDSLVYSLSTCYDNATTPINYNVGYSAAAPLGPSWGVSLDPVSGDMTFTPNPGNMVVGVLCVRIEEYRNGVKVGEFFRDQQVEVINCGGTAASGPIVDSLYNVTGGQQLGPRQFRACQGSPFSFTFAVHDVDTGDVLSSVYNFAQIPGATVTQQGTNPADFTFSYTPTQSGTFNFSITVVDSSCPIPNVNTQFFTLDVGSFCVDGAVTGAPCGVAQGAIDLTVSGGVQPYSFAWSNGDTTEDVSGLLPGQYSVTVTDSTGDSWTRTFIVDGTNISMSLAVTQPTCNAPTGTITTNITGGTAPFTYLWNTGDTTANLTGIPAGGYSVTAFDSSGCPSHKAVFVLPPDSCFNVIEGTVYQDVNGNCIQDANEPGLAYYLVDITPGGATVTDANGYYKILADTGSYTFTPSLWNFNSVNCPVGGIDSVRFDSLGMMSSGHDFAIHIDTVQDLKVYYAMGPARPGFDQNHWISVVNEGSLPMSGSLEWVHDGIFQYLSSVPTTNSYNATTRTADWTFSNLLPGQRFAVRVVTHVDSTIALGTWYTNQATALPIVGDTTPANNLAIINDTTTASYDPNDKLVTPQGLGVRGFIQPNENVMDYTVRFQNTGTDTAFYVVIRDTIDANLDYSTLRILGNSHPFSLDIEDDKVLVFRFDLINLPDSGTNFLESQGFISFSLGHKGTLAAGTEIRNKAAIYFDFNLPVITNEVLNTIYTSHL